MTNSHSSINFRWSCGYLTSHLKTMAMSSVLCRVMLQCFWSFLPACSSRFSTAHRSHCGRCCSDGRAGCTHCPGLDSQSSQILRSCQRRWALPQHWVHSRQLQMLRIPQWCSGGRSWGWVRAGSPPQERAGSPLSSPGTAWCRARCSYLPAGLGCRRWKDTARSRTCLWDGGKPEIQDQKWMQCRSCIALTFTQLRYQDNRSFPGILLGVEWGVNWEGNCILKYATRRWRLK